MVAVFASAYALTVLLLAFVFCVCFVLNLNLFCWFICAVQSRNQGRWKCICGKDELLLEVTPLLFICTTDPMAQGLSMGSKRRATCGGAAVPCDLSLRTRPCPPPRALLLTRCLVTHMPQLLEWALPGYPLPGHCPERAPHGPPSAQVCEAQYGESGRHTHEPVPPVRKCALMCCSEGLRLPEGVRVDRTLFPVYHLVCIQRTLCCLPQRFDSTLPQRFDLPPLSLTWHCLSPLPAPQTHATAETPLSARPGPTSLPPPTQLGVGTRCVCSVFFST